MFGPVTATRRPLSPVRDGSARNCGVIWLALALAWPAACPSLVAAAEPPGFVKGITWGWVGSRGDYASDAANQSMKEVAATGAQWVCIAFGAAMQDQSTTTIRWGENNPQMATDDEIRRAVALARENDLKVILKPTVNIDDGTWRAWVKFYRPLTQQESAAGNPGVVDRWGDSEVNRPADAVDLERWAAWWESFDEFLLHYAQLAEETDCEMLCLGCEMNSTEEFADRWRSLIARVRGVYQGPLTYDVNHHRELEVSWWDAVDLISVSAYYHVPPPAGLTEEEATRYTTGAAEIVAELRKIRDQLAEIHAKHQKPILFIETGVTSVRGCARYPWAHVDERQGDPVDLQEQVNYYQAMFDVFWDEPWFAGFCWWDWPARLYDPDHAAKDRTFCNFGKPAADVMKSWYAKPR